jgi:hypothetical protein
MSATRMKLVNLLPPTETDVRDSPKNTNVIVTLCGEIQGKGRKLENVKFDLALVRKLARKRRARFCS